MHKCMRELNQFKLILIREELDFLFWVNQERVFEWGILKDWNISQRYILTTAFWKQNLKKITDIV